MKNQTDGLIKVAQELVGTHGIFFAACLLADHDIPLAVALMALCGATPRPHEVPHRFERSGTA